jgi:hypothetical protein
MKTSLLNNKSSIQWTDVYSQYFLDKCKQKGLRNKTCQCVKSETEKRFSELDMQRLHYSSYHSDPNQVASARAQFYFPFAANGYFTQRMYPDTKMYHGEVVEKCDS